LRQNEQRVSLYEKVGGRGEVTWKDALGISPSFESRTRRLISWSQPGSLSPLTVFRGFHGL
jgi:hypothetical protein